MGEDQREEGTDFTSSRGTGSRVSFDCCSLYFLYPQLLPGPILSVTFPEAT